MLIKGGYVDGGKFVCKGDKNARPFEIQAENTAKLYDFPSHQNVSFSFMLFCDKNMDPFRCGRKIIASDMNPVFKRIRSQKNVYQQMDEFDKLKLNEQLRKSLSDNHAGRGQNILYGDGSVIYIQRRIIDGDDIFTVRGVDVYTGRETPSEVKDTFLAP